jgi:all-trans-retinol 13,14-reductase
MNKSLIEKMLKPVFRLPLIRGLNDGGESAVDYDVIIVGSGGGGMAAGARLSLEGKRVLVIERNDKTGGYMTNFKKGDYFFEVSMHSLDGFNEGWFNREMFRKLGIFNRMKPIMMDPMYRALYPDETLEIPASVNKYIAMLKDKFPHEREGIDRFFKALDKIEIATECGMHFSNREYAAGLFKTVMHLGALATFGRYWKSTLTEILDEYVHDKKLISMITQLTGLLSDAPGKISGLVFAAALNQYHKGGYYYFTGDGEGGGSRAVIRALESVIKENGGEIVLNTLVTRITVEDGEAKAVETEDGRKYSCRYVISNANAPQTVNRLVGRAYFPKKYLSKLDKMVPGLSCFVVYLGVDCDYRSYFPKGSHVILQNVSWDALESYKYIREGDVDRMPFAFLNFSCVDTVAPEGKNVLNITTVMPYDWKDGWHYDNKEKYEALKKETAMKLVKRAEKIIPGLSDHIEVMEVMTPKSLEAYSLNPRGAILGWDNTVDQSMLNRLPQETPVDNLYLAGAWTFPAGGQSTVLVSGLVAAEKILRRM